MPNTIGNIVIYANDPVALSQFWAAALGYTVLRFEGELKDSLLASGLTESDLATRSVAEDPAGVGPRMFFHHADGEKAGRNRIHVDVNVGRGGDSQNSDSAIDSGNDSDSEDSVLDAERDRLVGLGATVVRLIEQTWGVWPEHYYQMQDPEGNEFCLQ